MLFRPYKKYYIFKKIPIPLTPGIIPKHRYHIATKFGDLVGDVFLNEETFKSKLREKGTVETLDKTINGYIENAKNFEIDTIESVVPEKYKDKLVTVVNETKKVLLEQIEKYLQSEHFSNTIKELVEKEFDVITNTKLEKIIEPKKFEINLKEILTEILNNKEFIERIVNSIEKYVDSFFEKETTVEEFIPEGLIDLVMISINKAVPVVLPELGRVMDNSSIKSLMSEKIKSVLYQIIEDMNAFQKFWVGFIQPRKLIDKEVPNLVERFIAEIKKILENEETFLNVLKIIEDYISSIRGQQIKEVLKNVSAKKYNSVKSNIRRIINDFIEDKEIVIDTITNYTMDFIGSIEEKTIKDFLEGYSSDFNDKVRDFVVEKLIVLAQGEKTSSAINEFLNKNIDYAIYEMKIGKLDKYLSMSEERQKQVVSFISNVLISILEDQTPAILGAININAMIKNKMDSFSVQQVEKIIVNVVKSELNYINIFGGILGGLIGSINFFLQPLLEWFSKLFTN